MFFDELVDLVRKVFIKAEGLPNKMFIEVNENNWSKLLMMTTSIFMLDQAEASDLALETHELSGDLRYTETTF